MEDAFRATTDKQLGICLRLLFAEGLQPFVQTILNDKGKIEFRITINTTDDYLQDLIRKYEIMIA